MDVVKIFSKLLIYINEFGREPEKVALFLSQELKRHVSESDADLILRTTIDNEKYMRRYSNNIVGSLLALGKSPRYIADLLGIRIHTVYYHKRNPATKSFRCPALEAIVRHPLKDLEYTNRNSRDEYKEKAARSANTHF